MNKKTKVTYYTINKLRLIISIVEFMIAIVFMVFGLRIAAMILAGASGAMLKFAIHKKRSYKRMLNDYNNSIIAFN